ncbi:MAG: glycosyltransferase family 4 protein [Planctomycetota bacterium]
MKILMCSNSFPPSGGGSQRYALEVATHLKESGEEVTFITRYQNGSEEFDKKLSFPVIRKKSKLSLIIKFISLVMRMKPDIIFVAHRADFAALASFVNKFFGIPYVISVYGGEILHSFRTKSVKKNFAHSKKIIAISRFTKSLLTDLDVAEDKIVVVPCGTDPNLFHPDLNTEQVVKKHNLTNKKVILSVSRLVERKGHANVIAAMPEILEKIPEALYIIVGKGKEEDNLKKQVSQLILEEKVIFAGFVPDNEIPYYYAACDLFIMPSFPAQEGENVEGFGIAYLEANSCGKPVIGGKSGGTEDAVIDGKTGILVDPQNIEEITDAVVNILSDKSLAAQMGKNGRERVVTELNWSSVTKKILGILKDIVS